MTNAKKLRRILIYHVTSTIFKGLASQYIARVNDWANGEVIFGY
jgi:hypothetical protein